MSKTIRYRFNQIAAELGLICLIGGCVDRRSGTAADGGAGETTAE